MSSNGTVPAQNLSAEENILGAMLLKADVIDVVQEHVGPEDFYRESHGVIFSTAVAMHDRHEPVDAVTLNNELEKTGKLETVGGTAKIHSLASLVPATANASHYAKIVREAAILRGLTRAGMEITKLGQDQPGTVDELLHQAEQSLSNVSLRNRTVSTTLLTDGLEDYLNDVREAYSSGVAKTGLLTGYPPLDDVLMGMWPGQFILIAARPGQGKSTLGFNIAENLADREAKSLFVSLEMGRMELQERALARAARVDSYNLRSGKMTPPEALRLSAGIETVKKRGGILHVNDDGYMTLPALKAEATRLHRTEGIELLVVDYIQLMTPPKAETRNLEIGEISRGLKLLARRLNIPIIAIAQMSRAIETRGGADRRPQLSDLRDSGSLEQDADVVIFLHDKSNYDLDAEPDGMVEVIVAKNRKGRVDTAKLGYIRKYSSFQHIPDNPNGDTA